MVSKISFVIRSLLTFVPAGAAANRGDREIKTGFLACLKLLCAAEAMFVLL